MRSFKTALIFLAVWTVSCERPPVPPVVQLAEKQAAELQGTGVSIYYGREYEAYEKQLKAARESLNREDLKLGWWRHYEAVGADFKTVLDSGRVLLSKVTDYKRGRRADINEELKALRDKVGELDEMTVTTLERGPGRKEITRASVMLKEAEILLSQDKFDAAEKRLQDVAKSADLAGNAAAAHLSRYMDNQQIRTWRRWADETVAQSKESGIVVLVVSKLERKLTIYRNGIAFRSFDIGLGINGYSDKAYAGDNATPEGRYKIIKKIPASQYYKALLINYPNEEDERRFYQAKKRGELPYWIGIGGSIEIHGSGKDGLTRGCVSMDDQCMDVVYDMVRIGTPVTIVGTLDPDNPIIKTIKGR